jgi:hypothetical protein
MDIPKLHFYYAMPFDRQRKKLFEERGMPYPSAPEAQAKVGEYRTLWEEINAKDKIMKLIVEKCGVTLPRDVEVWIFGRGMSAMSSPFLVPAFRKDGTPYTRDQLIQTLIHEVLHRFTFDENNPGIPDYWRVIRAEYSDESPVTQNHIFVYALLDIVLTELYGQEQLGDFIQPWDSDYKRAVEIVAQKGAQNLLDQFRNFLK